MSIRGLRRAWRLLPTLAALALLCFVPAAFADVGDVLPPTVTAREVTPSGSAPVDGSWRRTPVTIRVTARDPDPDPGLLLVFDGNSLTAGSYPRMCVLDLTAPPLAWYNFAHGGQATQQMIADAGVQIDPLLERPHDTAILVAWEWVNDIRPVEQRMASMVEYCEWRRAAGWQVVVLSTISNRGEVAHDFAANNTYIDAHWPEFADALADVGSDGRIGIPGNWRDPTYFLSDGIHLTRAGNRIVAGGVRRAMQSLLPKGSGVAGITLAVDGGAPAAGDTAAISDEGIHTVRAWADDKAGNRSDELTLHVRIDATGPICTVTPEVSAGSGKLALLHFRVRDQLSQRAKVKVRLLTRGGRLLRTNRLGWEATNVALRAALRCPQTSGIYRYEVRATDLAGNQQARVGRGVLTVR